MGIRSLPKKTGFNFSPNSGKRKVQPPGISGFFCDFCDFAGFFRISSGSHSNSFQNPSRFCPECFGII